MKKSLLALAVLGAYAGVASAQSSVTLYGTMDVNGRYIKNDGSKSRLSLSQDGVNSSQLGLRAIEDLGGGLKAGFNIIAGINPDVGGSNLGTTPNQTTAGNQSKFWNRRSTVSLFSPAGELRLGRDYVPTFWNMTLFDAFGTNGLGDSTNTRQLYNGTRSDNAVQYFLPSNLGGFYGQAMAAASEGGTNLDKPARYYGGRLGFAAGPFDVAVAYSTERYVLAAAPVTIGSSHPGGLTFPMFSGAQLKTFNIGGTYDFGFVKLLGYYDHESAPTATEKMFSVSAVVPLGQGEIHVGYDQSKLDTTRDRTVAAYKATYQYNLSKRTAMYGTIAEINNKDGTQITLGAAGSSATALPSVSGGKSKGFELGVRHFF